MSEVEELRAAPSATLHTMLVLRAALVTGCLLVGGLCFLGFGEAHTAAESIGNRTAPALMQLEAASSALSDAQEAAVSGVYSHSGEMSGPGQQYENDIAAVNQSLEQVAGDNTAGADALSHIQLVGALLSTYNDEVARVYADYSQNTSTELATADLWDAANTLATVQGDLGALTDLESSTLAAQRSSVWLSGAAYLIWLMPAAALGIVFSITYTVLRRRYRRRLSLRLTVGVAAIAVSVLICGLALRSTESNLNSALSGQFADNGRSSAEQVQISSAQARDEFVSLLKQSCPTANLCGTRLAAVTAPAESSTTLAAQIENDGSRYASVVAAAVSSYELWATLIVLLSVGAAALSAFGLRQRIEEYRFT